MIADMMTSRFDQETALTRKDETAFEGQTARSWWVERGPNGGFLAAVLLRALAMMVNDSDYTPCSLTVQFLEPPVEGAFQIHTQVERVGRTMAMVSGRLFQAGKLLAIALSSFSKPRTSVTLADAVLPNVLPPEALAPFPTHTMPPFASNYDMRWAMGNPPFSGSQRSLAGGWTRLKELRVADALAVTAFTDGWVPCVFPRMAQPAAVPTIDLTIHFRARLPLADAKADDFYLVVFNSCLGAGGFFDENGEIWSRNGVLIAQSRQLALLPPLK